MIWRRGLPRVPIKDYIWSHKYEIIEVLKTVPDHRFSVCSLKVSFHYFIKFSITENHRLETETFCAKQIYGFLVFVRKPEINNVKPSKWNAFRLVQENSNIQISEFKQVYFCFTNLRVSLSQRNSILSNFGQNFARESIIWSTWIFVWIFSDVPMTRILKQFSLICFYINFHKKHLALTSLER